ncbi:MAG: dihydroorotate dehydrogenase electron transfer subunit [bacterium]
MKNAGKKFHTTGRVLRNREIAADLFEISIECPEIARAAAPGQFVNARAWEETSPLLRRPFSIARAGGDAIILIVKKVGPATEIICGRKKGEAVSLLGPLGRGFPPPEKGGRYLLVAGGFGIAPLLFFATRARAAGGVILFGANSKGHLPASIEKHLPKNWKMLYATIDGSRGKKGLVTGLLTAELKKSKKWNAIYACGPVPMMKAAAAIAAKRSLPCLVSMETHMACGVGACMGCPVPVIESGKPAYKMACADGPVFDADEIRWEETA